MNFIEKLDKCIDANDSLLCVGLDPDRAKFPECLKDCENDIFEFNKAIIDATADLVCAYKPQIAYYAGQSAEDQLQLTIDYLREKYPHIPVILDSKRGDIGSTAQMYAKEAFERYQADAVTVNPYMGLDTLKPFLDYSDKGVVILCRTSNPSSSELQELCCGDRPLYKHVAALAQDKWNYNNNIVLVIGATFPAELSEVRKICPNIPFLVPGVGAQGGDVAEVLRGGADARGRGLIINSSRGIIYAGRDEKFAAASGKAALELRDLINAHRGVKS